MSILFEDDVTFLRTEFNAFLDDYGFNVTLRHYTGQTPAGDYDDYYNAMNVDDESNSWSYTDTTILVFFQYETLSKREEREMVTIIGGLIQRIATIFVKNDVTISQGDEIIHNDETFKVETVIPHQLSKGDETAYTVYYECKIQKTLDVIQ